MRARHAPLPVVGALMAAACRARREAASTVESSGEWHSESVWGMSLASLDSLGLMAEVELEEPQLYLMADSDGTARAVMSAGRMSLRRTLNREIGCREVVGEASENTAVVTGAAASATRTDLSGGHAGALIGLAAIVVAAIVLRKVIS